MTEPIEVEQYLAALPVESRAALEALRAIIRAAAPEATETISYRMPSFEYDGRSLVAYGAFKHHCSLFPMSTRVIERYAKELEPFRSGKGTIRFEPGRPLPADLVTRLVKARIQENARS